MSQKQRVKYTLDSGEVHILEENEIKIILRAADELINTGGRSMLAKILKGSKDKKVLEYHLDKCPSYGFYKELTIEEITNRIDLLIKKHYLKIEYNGRLPMLVFTEQGWEIERETFAEELYYRFSEGADKNTGNIIFEMKDVNRSVIFDVLEKIRNSGNAKFIVLLEAWKIIEVRKVRERINSVINSLSEK